MKLIRCTACQDVVCLSRDPRCCTCGASGGFYKPDGDHIFVTGPSEVYGLDNKVFTTGRGYAFRYPEDNGKVERG